ncbi:MAG: protein kinase [Bacteroidota bacterium]
MTLRGLNNEQYTIARELGRGGEGTVYELRGHSSLVLKRYNERLTTEKTEKLRQMVAMKSDGIEAYAAWPVNLVLDDYGNVCGFVMKKLTGFVPLHMIFSPMDRKKLFPDKGYNFLVHVARNLATAFYKLHEAGLVVGDVNEGNILVSAAGLVAFIDCDSFQVKGRDCYYYCEVGVPRYTPPELLKHGSFEHIERTVNTDSFSMAVLLFQLLFLGRHPFAGKHKSAADIDEETAIRQRQFAYSLDNKKKKLSPPNNSFEITNLNDDLVSLFHQAFEKDERPLPAEWVKALEHQLGDMVTCSMTRLHTYPAKLQQCPWCAFRQAKGILYFLDDTYLHAHAVLGDIESFVNGFKLEKLELKKWSGPLSFPHVAATPIDRKFYRYKSARVWAIVVVAIVNYVLVNVSLAFFPSFFLIGLIYTHSPWTRSINKERQRRVQEYTLLLGQRTRLVAVYNDPPDLEAYNRGLQTLQQYVGDFTRMPEELQRRKKAMEEDVYNEQLDDFLRQFYIDEHAIPSFGPAKKNTLLAHGIRTAADVSRLQHVKVPGIGPANIEILKSWRRQMETQFVYIPDDQLINTRMQDVNNDMGRIRLNLENAIRNEFQSLNYIKANINNRAAILAGQINDISARTFEAELNMMEFKRVF